MPREKLTPAFCMKAAPLPGAERTYYWHTKREGFGLMVTANGSRSFVVQYRIGGRARRITIDGKLSLGEAEQQAKKIQGEVAKGLDPLAERQKGKNMLRTIAEEFLAREGKKLRSIDERAAIFERHIFKTLGA